MERDMRSIAAIVGATGIAMICGMLTPSQVNAGAITLAPSQDANVTNAGALDSRTSTPSPGGGNEGGFLTVNWYDAAYNYGLIQFDLSALAGDTITSASLDLYHIYNSDPASIFGVFRNTASWNSLTTDYNNAPSYDPTAIVTKNITDSGGGIVEAFDVTGLVQNWVNGTFANDGISFIRTNQTNPVLYFAATGHGSDAEQLIVNFTSPVPSVPEPTPLGLFGAGLLGLAGIATLRRRRPI
jgi:hypothetical protein